MPFETRTITGDQQTPQETNINYWRQADTETIGDRWRPLESSTDHWRPAETTGNHWKQAETTGDQQRPLWSSRHHCPHTKPPEDQQILLEISRLLQTKRCLLKPERSLETSKHHRKPTSTIGDKQTPTLTSQTQQRPLQASTDQWRPADTTGDQQTPPETTRYHLRPIDSNSSRLAKTYRDY